MTAHAPVSHPFAVCHRRQRRSALRQEPGLGLRTEGDQGLLPLQKGIGNKSVGDDGVEGILMQTCAWAEALEDGFPVGSEGTSI